MSLAIGDEQVALATSVATFLRDHEVRAANRALLEALEESLPAIWSQICELGWLGLHLPETYGGSGYGIPELAIVVEQFGAAVAPGPFVPTVIVSALIAAAGDASAKEDFLPSLASGNRTAGLCLGGNLELRGSELYGSTDAVLGGGLADLVLVPVGADVAIVQVTGTGVTAEVPANLDPARRSAHFTFDGAAAEVIGGAASLLADLASVLLGAEAVGIARECTETAAAYAKVREQFGRPIATFQAVKHHCANMLVATELATAAVWDAARAVETGGDQLTYAAAVAAERAGTAGAYCADLSMQVLGGIGMTWEHDAHLFLRRAIVDRTFLDPHRASLHLTELTRAGVVRDRIVNLPPEAESVRAEVAQFALSLQGKDSDAQRDALIETGYVMPHWPKPWGREAGALEQLVIETEFSEAGVERPRYGITAWVILTLIQHATPEQVSRWVPDALQQKIIWCQLFSEPEAGSDAAGVKTKGVRVDGGWLINGQKVWTSDAQVSGRGLATIRTNPTAPKHAGITTMVIDMHAPGVEVRPLRLTTGGAHFNEVFLTDVFVPDADVVGPVDGGWTVARATLGNESVSIGGDLSLVRAPATLLGPFDAHPERLAGGAGRVGQYIATYQAMALLNLRSASRALAGSGPGPEGAVTKLVQSELNQEAAAIVTDLSGTDIAFTDGERMITAASVLMSRATSIAGGTSEIKRNQIGERLLGLPRDPLI
jgi:3-oxochol-4-en-24-oyl-CoA dehydrogenase